MVAQQMKPGRGDQSRQLLQQVYRREQEMAGAIRPQRIRQAQVKVDLPVVPPPHAQRGRDREHVPRRDDGVGGDARDLGESRLGKNLDAVLGLPHLQV